MKRALIFDSGVGGISVVQEIRKLLPELSLSYAADDEFRPYGNKSEEALRERLPELLRVLTDIVSPDVIVIACNTASTTALADIRQAVDIPVIGVVPAIKPAAAISQTKVIGVLGTPGTVRRKYVDTLISEFAQDCHVILHGSVSLVKMAEDKLSGQAIAPEAVQQELSGLFGQPRGSEIDSVVLACTHFPLLKNEFELVYPHAVHWIDSGLAIAKRVATVLESSDGNAIESREKDTAFLIGPEPTEQRRATFHNYGFGRVVSLEQIVER